MLPNMHCEQTTLSTRGHPRSAHLTIDAVKVASPHVNVTHKLFLFVYLQCSCFTQFGFFYHQNMLIKCHRSQQSH